MNFIDVSVDATGDGIRLGNNAFEIEMSQEFAESSPDVDRTTLGIRPEDIEVQSDSDRQTVTVEVDVVEPLGREQILYFNLGDKTFTASTSGYAQVEAGQEITVMFPESRLHLFDAITGETIKKRAATTDSPPTVEQF